MSGAREPMMVGRGIKHLRVIPEEGRSHMLPPWGYIEEIRLRPAELLPNMDAASLYRLSVVLYSPDGRSLPLDVELVCRSVATPEEMLGQ